MSSVWAVENDRKLEKRTADFMLWTTKKRIHKMKMGEEDGIYLGEVCHKKNYLLVSSIIVIIIIFSSNVYDKHSRSGS